MALNALPFSLRELACRQPSGWVDSKGLGAGVAEVFDVPVGAKFVLISSTTPIYINPGAAAAVPADVTDGTASELVMEPIMLMIENFTTIGVIAPAASVVTASYYT